jgi:hypothetical protein
MTGRKVRRVWPLLAAPLLLSGCAAPYSPGGWGPPNPNARYYHPPPPGHFVWIPKAGGLNEVPADWTVPTPPPYRAPEPEPFDEPKQAAVIPAPELKPAAKPIEVIAPKPERQPDPPAPVKAPIAQLPPTGQPPASPPAEGDDCTGWWRICHFFF